MTVDDFLQAQFGGYTVTRLLETTETGWRFACSPPGGRYSGLGNAIGGLDLGQVSKEFVIEFVRCTAAAATVWEDRPRSADRPPPEIVPWHQTGRYAEGIYTIVELAGESLAVLGERRMPFPMEDMVVAVATALEHLHRYQTPHGRIGPDRILRFHDGWRLLPPVPDVGKGSHDFASEARRDLLAFSAIILTSLTTSLPTEEQSRWQTIAAMLEHEQTTARAACLVLGIFPGPVTDLRATAADGGVVFQWRPARTGQARVYRFRRIPRFVNPEVPTQAELMAQGVALPSLGSGKAIDRIAPDQATYYQAITFDGNNRAVAVGSLLLFPPVPDLIAPKAEDLGGSLQIRWEWPDTVERARIAWRRDRHPTEPEEPGAEHRMHHRVPSGLEPPFRLERRGVEGYYFTLFSVITVDGTAHYSLGVHQTIGEAPTQIQYHIRRILSRRNSFRVSMLITGRPGPVPALRVVYRAGRLLPLQGARETIDLIVLRHFEAENGRAEAVFEGPPISGPFRLRLLLQVPDDAARYRLIEQAPAALSFG